MKVLILFSILLIFSGCSTTDPSAVQMLNRRIQMLETQASEQKKGVIPFKNMGPYRLSPLSDPFIFVFIDNENGSQIPVKLRQIGVDYWVGPNGEYYKTLPTKQQLEQIYRIRR